MALIAYLGSQHPFRPVFPCELPVFKPNLDASFVFFIQKATGRGLVAFLFICLVFEFPKRISDVVRPIEVP